MTLTSNSTLLRSLLLLTLALSLVTTSPAQESSAPTQPSAAQLALYVGQYQYDDSPGTILSISLEGSHLFVESARAPHQELAPQPSPDVFLPVNNPTVAIFKFLRTDDGKVSGLLRIAGDKSTRHAKKISDQPLQFDKPELHAPGSYDPGRATASSCTPSSCAQRFHRAASVPYGTHALRRRRHTRSDSINSRAPRARHEPLHLRLRGHSRPLQVRRHLRHEPPR